MKKLSALTLVFLLLLLLISCKAKDSDGKSKAPVDDSAVIEADSDVSVPDEALYSDPYFRICDPDGNIVVSEGNIVSMERFTDTPDGSCYLLFVLDNDGINAFSAATTEYIGEKLPVYFDETVVAEPLVVEAINDGKFRLPLNNADDVQALFEKISLAMHGNYP